jgi:hypothetical protein
MGFWLDVFVEFLIRVVQRGINLLRGRHWPFTPGVVKSVECPDPIMGCHLVVVHYEYRFNGEAFTGTFKKPFIWSGSARSFMKEHNKYSSFGVRVNPRHPAVSIHAN